MQSVAEQAEERNNGSKRGDEASGYRPPSAGVVVTLRPLPVDVADLVEPPPAARRVLVHNDVPFFAEVLRHPTELMPSLVSFGNDVAVPISDTATIRQIQERINSMIAMPIDNLRLPGPNPVALQRKDIPMLYNLEHGPYHFSYKADGVRCWLLITKMYDELRVVAINRARRCVYISLPVPESYAEGTILDGEVVKSTVDGQYHFLLFDVVAVQGIPCFRRSFTYHKRLNCIGKGVEADLAAALDTAKAQSSQQPLRYAFQVSVKPVVPMSESRNFVERVWPTVPFRTDGFVMSPNCDGVRFGQHPRMFKLKDLAHCLGDFQCILDPSTATTTSNADRSESKREASFLGSQIPIAPPFQDPVFPPDVPFVKVALACATDDGSRLLYYTYSFITEGLLTGTLRRKSIEDLQNVILACRYDSSRGLWVPVEVLDEDRTAPNALNTIKKLLINMEENIQLDEVLPPRRPLQAGDSHLVTQ